MGKTTALRAVVGLAPVVRGRVFFDGREVQGLAPHDIIARGIAHFGYVLETGRLGLAGTGAELLAHPRLQDPYLGDDWETEEPGPASPS